MNKLMEILHSKRKDKKGFTLMEMLIVVAIIAILVAIAVPTFNSSLDAAKQAADDANMRTARAVAAAQIVEHDYDNTKPELVVDSYFDITTGTFVKTRPTTNYGKIGSNKDKVIQFTERKDTGEIVLIWV